MRVHMYMCVHVCMSVCMCVYMYVCICVYVSVCTCIYTRVCIYMCVCVGMYASACVCVSVSGTNVCTCKTTTSGGIPQAPLTLFYEPGFLLALDFPRRLG